MKSNSELNSSSDNSSSDNSSTNKSSSNNSDHSSSNKSSSNNSDHLSSNKSSLNDYKALDNINIILSQDEKNEFINKDFVNICKNYQYIPTIIPAVKRIIVFGDIHGDFNLAIKLLEIGKVIEKTNDGEIKWVGKDTFVVQVGDQIDRCRPQSVCKLLCSDPKATVNDEGSDLKILKLFNNLHEQAIKYGGKVISLLGNHEIMNADGNMNYVSYEGLKEFDDFVDPDNNNIKFKSGKDARIYAFSPGKPIGRLLGCSRLSAVIIGSNLFVHAGMVDLLLDKLNIKKPGDLESINILIKKWLLGLINKEYVKHIIENNKSSMFWTRILGGIPPNVSNENCECVEHISKVLKLFNIGTIIIGHTPQSFKCNQGINSTCGNSIWRVDNASSSAFHGYDDKYMKTKETNSYRKPQVLEIINDNIFTVLK